VSLAAALPLVEELAAEGAVRGALRAGGASWVPDAYAHRQRAAVQTFYAQNGFIECAPCCKAARTVL
jgi:hypothetical protein